ncbi:MAG TPA: hypothetical protein PLA71_00370 [Saccharofermentans sp.]|nr:hypothetical protein [Saccharofermentans sp.]
MKFNETVKNILNKNIKTNQCIHYGDCPFNVMDCPEDNPRAKCKHRVINKEKQDKG